MLKYFLTLLCSAAILLTAYFAIRYRKVNAYLRIASLILAAAYVVFLYFYYDDSTQLYGLGILAIALVFPVIDVMRHAKKQKVKA